jgi:hypothetical protein
MDAHRAVREISQVVSGVLPDITLQAFVRMHVAARSRLTCTRRAG